MPLLEVVAKTGHIVPKELFLAAATITAGMPLILDNSGAGIGNVKEALSSNGSFVSTSMEGGLVGVAENDASAGEMVVVKCLTGVSNRLRLPSYGAAPSETLLGVAPTTYYGLYRDAGVWKVDLGTTANGVARFVNFDFTYSETFSDVIDSPGGVVMDLDNFAVGDYVYVEIPEAFRHFK